MATIIHPTAIIDSKAEIGDDCYIGPYSLIGPKVKLGNGVSLKSHVVIEGHTQIGEYTEIFPFASIGHVTQDKKYQGEDSELVIGDHNVIREHVTMNPGTKGGGMVTKVGNNCLFMIASHVAHDCIVGDYVIMANNATLAGHVVVEDYAIIGGLSAVHQFTRVGKHSIIGGMTGIERDVIPYGAAMGERAFLAGLNIIGMKRNGLSKEVINAIRDAYDILFPSDKTGRSNSLEARIEQVSKTYANVEEVMSLISFLRYDSARPICQPKYCENER